MKYIYISLLAALSLGTITSCSDEAPFSTVSENDLPFILSPVFPESAPDGTPGLLTTITHDVEYKMDVVVTPADYSTVTWFIDGVETAKGTKFAKTFPTGMYLLKVVAKTTKGLETYRQGYIQVNPLAGEPYTDMKADNFAAPGFSVTLKGGNLNLVTSIRLGDGIDIAEVHPSDDGSEISFVVPAEVADGTYRVTLFTADGVGYGGNNLTVTSNPMVQNGFARVTSGAVFTLTGMSLNNVKSLTLVGEDGEEHVISEFVSQESATLQVLCPVLPEGLYRFYGEAVDGSEVMFFDYGVLVPEVTITVPVEQTIWEGHHYVSWELADGDPNKTFSALQSEVGKLPAGTKLRIYYSIYNETGYHQMQVTSAWWSDLPGTGKIDLDADGVRLVELTQEQLDLINSQDGFLVVGHGFYVDRVTIE